MKQLWMLVGGNGSGKSTFYEQMLKPKGMPFINADIIAKEAFPDDPVNNSHKAARIAEELRFDKLRQGYSFCFETVFSHVSKPADKILSRLPRTFDNVKAAIPLCDEVHVLDNSRLDDPFKRVLSIINSQISARVDAALPSWVLALIGE